MLPEKNGTVMVSKFLRGPIVIDIIVAIMYRYSVPLLSVVCIQALVGVASPSDLVGALIEKPQLALMPVALPDLNWRTIVVSLTWQIHAQHVVAGQSDLKNPPIMLSSLVGTHGLQGQTVLCKEFVFFHKQILGNCQMMSTRQSNVLREHW